MHPKARKASAELSWYLDPSVFLLDTTGGSWRRRPVEIFPTRRNRNAHLQGDQDRINGVRPDIQQLTKTLEIGRATRNSIGLVFILPYPQATHNPFDSGTLPVQTRHQERKKEGYQVLKPKSPMSKNIYLRPPSPKTPKPLPKSLGSGPRSNLPFFPQAAVP